MTRISPGKRPSRTRERLPWRVYRVSTTRTLVLLDVDGVLVHPVGYKDALRATIDIIAAQMGLAIPPITDDEIAVFEACGITNEWDSGAMCASALLLSALAMRPDLHRATLTDTFAAIRAAGLTLPRPDFTIEARALAASHADGHHPAQAHLARLATRTDAATLPLLQALLGNVYDVLRAPITHLFQTHTLGSARFLETYGAQAPVETESFLTTRDRALLAPDSRDRLIAWAQQPAHGATVFTARPSLRPADLASDTAPGNSITGFAPEAELAMELLELNGHIPLIGQGRVGWLAWQNGREAADYVKPSPVQALAAIGAAASGHEMESLVAAAALVERDTLTGPLAELRDQAVRVIVFEDSTGGIRATRGAVEHLQRAGVNASFAAVGISPNADKRAALSMVTDQVVDDINAGLTLALSW